MSANLSYSLKVVFGFSQHFMMEIFKHKAWKNCTMIIVKSSPTFYNCQHFSIFIWSYIMYIYYIHLSIHLTFWCCSNWVPNTTTLHTCKVLAYQEFLFFIKWIYIDFSLYLESIDPTLGSDPYSQSGTFYSLNWMSVVLKITLAKTQL